MSRKHQHQQQRGPSVSTAVSVESLARTALTADTAAHTEYAERIKASALAAEAGAARALAANDSSRPTVDSFQNFAHKLGMGADSILTSSSYSFNPITRNRQLLEWVYRGTWLGRLVINIIADDMTRAGIDFTTELPPDDMDKLITTAARQDMWTQINFVVRWGRLYGGAVGVALIDGHDMSTPLNMNAVTPEYQYRGMMVLDRWMLEPSLNDLVTDFGPHFGLPRWYRIGSNAPGLRGIKVHHTRVLFRHIGDALPYQQALTENLWGLSVIEPMYDRMLGYDLASTGMIQLVNKAHIRTLSVEGMRNIVAAGGKQMEGLASYTDMMRRFQGIEGVTLIDAKDKMEVLQHSAFSGLSDVMSQMGEQLSGCTQIPLVRMFGQSPSGFSTGDTDVRNYYDTVNQRQERDLHHGVTLNYKLIAASQGVRLPPDFGVKFRSLWQLTDKDKADYAASVTETVGKAMDSALYGQKTALKELKQASRVSGIHTNVTQDMINAASDDIMPQGMPGAEEAMGGPLGAEGEAPPIGEGVSGMPNAPQVQKTGPEATPGASSIPGGL